MFLYVFFPLIYADITIIEDITHSELQRAAQVKLLSNPVCLIKWHILCKRLHWCVCLMFIWAQCLSLNTFMLFFSQLRFLLSLFPHYELTSICVK